MLAKVYIINEEKNKNKRRGSTFLFDTHGPWSRFLLNSYCIVFKYKCPVTVISFFLFSELFAAHVILSADDVLALTFLWTPYLIFIIKKDLICICHDGGGENKQTKYVDTIKIYNKRERIFSEMTFIRIVFLKNRRR